MPPKPLLFLFESAPYTGHTMREGIEALFAARIFDIPCTVVFLQDGVYAGQQTNGNITKLLASLPMYDIETIRFHTPSLEQRNVAPSLTGIETQTIDDSELAVLFQQHHHCLSF